MSKAETEYPFARSLKTPREDIARHNSRIVRVPLLESQHLHTAGAAYNLIPPAEATFDDLIEAGRSVSRVVRDTLWFRKLQPGEELTPESLNENAATNCHGYSIVGSESLQASSLPHYVGFANEHSFLLLLDDRGSNRSYVLGGADKKLYAEATKAISGKSPIEQIGEGRRFAHNGFYSQEFLAAAGLVLDDDIALKHSWLGFRREGATRFLETEGQVRLLDKVQLRTYPALLGREVLANYAKLQALLGGKKLNQPRLEAATAAMTALDGIFPEMDQRNKFRLPTQLRGQLIQHKMTQEAQEVAWAFDRSRTWNDMSAFFLPDTLRMVGVVANKASYIDEAIDIYSSLPADNPHRLIAIRKASKAHRERVRVKES